jgi:hypothetical protein
MLSYAMTIGNSNTLYHPMLTPHVITSCGHTSYVIIPFYPPNVIIPCYRPMIKPILSSHFILIGYKTLLLSPNNSYHPLLSLFSAQVSIQCYQPMISSHVITPCYNPMLLPHAIIPCYFPML